MFNPMKIGSRSAFITWFPDMDLPHWLMCKCGEYDVRLELKSSSLDVYECLYWLNVSWLIRFPVGNILLPNSCLKTLTDHVTFECSGTKLLTTHQCVVSVFILHGFWI